MRQYSAQRTARGKRDWGRKGKQCKAEKKSARQACRILCRDWHTERHPRAFLP